MHAQRRFRTLKSFLFPQLTLCLVLGCAPETSDAPGIPRGEQSIQQALDDGHISTEEIRVGLNYFATWSWKYYNWKHCALDQFGRTDAWVGVRDFHDGNTLGWGKNVEISGSVKQCPIEPVPSSTESWSFKLESGVNVSEETYERLWSQLKPYSGYYDLNPDSELGVRGLGPGTSVVEKQIRQAKAHGFDYFNFWWYWRNENSATPVEGAVGSQEVYNAALFDGNCDDGVCGSFTRASNTNDMKFMISVIADRNDFAGSVTPITKDDYLKFFTILKQYFAMPNYLRDADGRPIINFLGVGGFVEVNPAVVDPFPTFIATLKSQTTVGGIEPLVLIDHTQKEKLHAAGGTMYSSVGDGYSCLGEWLGNLWVGDQIQPGDYLAGVNQQISLFNSFWTLVNPKPTLPCMFTDYNEMQRTGTQKVPQRLGVENAGTAFVKNWSRYAMREAARGIRESYLGAHNSSTNPLRGLVSVHAWNEWGEQLAAVEPSESYEDEIAAHLAAGFGLAPRGRKSCRVAGSASGDCDFDVLGTRWVLTEPGVRVATVALAEARSSRFADGTYQYEAGVVGDTTIFFSRRDPATNAVCQYWGTLSGPNLDMVVGGMTDCGAFSWSLQIVRDRIVQRTLSPSNRSVTWPGHRDPAYSVEAGALAFPVYETGDAAKKPIFNCHLSSTDEMVSNDPACEVGLQHPPLIGYLWKSAGEGHTRPIYRCRTVTHYVSGDGACEGGIFDTTLGYADDTIVVRRTMGSGDHGVDFAGFNRWSIEPRATSFGVDVVQKPGQQAVYNCLVGGSEEMLSTSPSCEGQPFAAPARIGYLFSSSGVGHSRPIFRCRGLDHFVSDDPLCEGASNVQEAVLGYTYDAVVPVTRTAGAGGDHGVAFKGFRRHADEPGVPGFSVNAIREVGQVPLYNCLVAGWDEMVSRQIDCEGQAPTSPSLLGYVWPSNDAGHTRGIYRCTTLTEHFISLDPGCEGSALDTVLGYIP